MNRPNRLWLLVLCMVASSCSADPTTTHLLTPDGAAVATTELTVETDPASPDRDVEPIDEITTTLVAGSGFGPDAQALLETQFGIETLDVATINHVASVESIEPTTYLLHYKQDGWFCASSLDGARWTSSECSQNDQMTFGRPFLRRVSTTESGAFRVWVSNAPDEATVFVVETDQARRFGSNVVNNTGYVLTVDGATPIEAHLFDDSGELLWSATIDT